MMQGGAVEAGPSVLSRDDEDSGQYKMRRMEDRQDSHYWHRARQRLGEGTRATAGSNGKGTRKEGKWWRLTSFPFLLPFFLGAVSAEAAALDAFARAAMTLPRVVNDLLMFAPSFSLAPVAPGRGPFQKAAVKP